MRPEDTLPRGAPQWSGDGSELALAVRGGERNFAEIVSLQTQEARRIPLPRREGNIDLELSWSPDERTFAYVDASNYLASFTQLWVVALDGSEPSPVTDGTMNDWSPSWSSDGRHLFFVSNRGGTMDLWQQRIGRDRQPRDEPKPVTAGIGIRSAIFSPDGTKLAYSRGQQVHNVWRVPILDGRPATWADAEQLTFDNALVEYRTSRRTARDSSSTRTAAETRIYGFSGWTAER